MDDVNYIKKITIEYLDGSIEEREGESLFVVIINDEANAYEMIPTEDVGEDVFIDFAEDVLDMYENVYVFEPEPYLRLVKNDDT